MTVRTRFAPSPTGYMHLGGMRTALFNWLWAKKNNGQFILRIDDTDQQRNLDEALAPILHAFKWLGLHWDEGPEVGGPLGPYFQSQRGELYREAGERLIANGKAYKDFDSPDAIKADREAAEKEKRNYLNVRRSLELTADQIAKHESDDLPYVVRLLVPRDRTVAIEDAIRGHVEWNCGLIPDPVIQRNDGSALYNFATVVDDAALQITDVIRGEEHLTNTAIQVLIYDALGLDLPRFAHIPYVAAPASKEKLSKRKLDKYEKHRAFRKLFEQAERLISQLGRSKDDRLNPVLVSFYEEVGYLPAGLLNSLVRLGWSLDDKTEYFSLDDMVRQFSLDRIIKSPAGFDPDKLLDYQSHWINELTIEARTELCLPYLLEAKLIKSSDTDSRAFVGRLIVALGDRLKVASDILDHSDFFTADSALPFDEKAFKKRVLKVGAPELLAKFRARLEATESFDAGSLDKLMHDFVETEGIGIGDIIHAVRVAATGKGNGPGMFDCLELLGQSACLKRIDRALAKASAAMES
ncbi:MAG: glutamate--tRNA ligase [Planctomycetota bacterium]|nr:glutamate--tRNA ligase [Planctomycetota bacterium]